MIVAAECGRDARNDLRCGRDAGASSGERYRTLALAAITRLVGDSREFNVKVWGG